ncbi:hypothetical protein DEU56DRAFT_23610 [Suillus clintonianus]|uniref:uncharacterized protein n=1 Tax=Suillus clintonianus TaxID=1904413 RepID=UPI001B85EA5B|nr:uncharacterized protein DEU56DRAFT_23610 [Suillus clintonianus]KAG2157513.1 hypothetical protein DEU56DRAFT_23610 [Suillus clintonianus]
MYTSAQSRHARAISPPLSANTSSHTFTATAQQSKLNVVTRLAIEGKAKQGQDGIAIKMYLKLSIPMDAVSPGSTLPLFPEGNLKMLGSEVHPTDTNSAPYNFSSTTSPLLNNTARALNLPARSQKSYLSVFGLPTSSASVMSPASRASSSTSTSHVTAIPPLDDKYTGHILVSGYNISYVLPKEFPPRFGEDSAIRVSTFSAAKMRRGSVGERNNMHFMAGLDLWVPYICRPPKAPFLISIPIPRCLSNNVRLRIFPPSSTTTSASFASLSSAEEDPGAWELTSEPHVTRTTSRPSRSGSYADMADDESSDSSAYTDRGSGGIAILGTFPSADRLRVRWAAPMKTIDSKDGRRRVGVKEVKGEMTCHVLGKDTDPKSGREGILMRLEYKGTAKGVWFPGVATMLGMDVGLEARGSDVIWAPAEEPTWTVAGGTGYTGFDINPPSTPVSRQASLEFPQTSPLEFASNSRLQAPAPATRHDSSSSAGSTSSLLRAPLPGDSLPDYSFESSPTSLTPSGTLSSISSMPLTSEGRSRANSDVQSNPHPPTSLTIHVNMNDILPPSKNVFTFNITGTILIISRPRAFNGHPSGSNASPDGEADPIPIVLPRFSVLAADAETIATIIRNECEAATVEVYNISGNLRDAQTRRTVLQRGGLTRCGSDGGRIALRSISRSLIPTRHSSTADDTLENIRRSPSRPRTPTGMNRVATGVSLPPMFGALSRRKRDGPLMIPSVTVVVTPLLFEYATPTDSYAVRVSHPAPCEMDTDWMEFGLAYADNASSKDCGLPSVEIASVSIDGMPVRFEISASTKHEEGSNIDLSSSLDKLGSKSWVAWVRVHVGDLIGDVQIDYLVKTSNDGLRRGKDKTKGDGYVGILLPTFTIPVGKLEVTVESSTGLDAHSIRSNLAHQHASKQGSRLVHYILEEMFTPTLSLKAQPHVHRFHISGRFLGRLLQFLIWTAPALLVLMVLLNLGAEFRHMRHSLDRRTPLGDPDRHNHPPVSIETVFIATTIYAPPHAKPSVGYTTASTTPSTSYSIPPAVMEGSRAHTALSSLVSPPPSPLSSGTATEKMSPSLTPTPTPTSTSDENSLSLIDVLPFTWPLKMDLPPVAQQTVDTVLEGLGVVWQVFRRVYHYPLDPP